MSRAQRRWTLAVFAIGFAWAVVFLSCYGFLQRPPFAEEANIALHLSRGEGFRSAFDLRGSAPFTSWSPPLYPAVIAAAYQWFGVRTPAAVTALMLVNAGCFGLILAAAFRLGELLFSRAAGLIAAVLIAIHPLFLHFAGDFWDSYVALVIFLWALVITATMAAAPPRAKILWLALLGASLGILALDNASYAATFPLIVLLALRRAPVRQKLAGVAASFVAFLLVLLPWTIRNYDTFGRLYFVRGGPEFELWLGNQPVSDGWLGPLTLERHPLRNLAERRSLLTMGEPAYFDLCAKRFREELRDDPMGFLRRTGSRALDLLLSEPSRATKYPFMPERIWRGWYIDKVILNSLVVILGFAGAWAAWRLRFGTWWLLWTALLAMTPFYFTSASDRYSLPLRLILLIYGGFLLWATARRLASGTWPQGHEQSSRAVSN